MQPSRIHHVGLPVSDLDLSVAWYREALGLTHDSTELLFIEPFDFPQDEIALCVEESVEGLDLRRCDWPFRDYAARSFLYAV
ncbi:MAG: VOC family protein [Actinomycetota bacterium]